MRRSGRPPSGAIADVLRRCVPALGARARDLAHTLVALVVTSAAAGTQVLPDDLWRQAGPIVRGHLSEAGAGPSL